MAKIRSTLEIALERAAKFEMDEAEVREARVKSHLDRVFEECGFSEAAEPDTERLNSALAKVPEEIAGDVRLGLLKNLLGRLCLAKSDYNVLDAARAVAEPERREALERLAAGVRKGLRRKGAMEEEARTGVLDKLEAREISGSAVRVEPGGQEDRADELAGLNEEIAALVAAVVE